MQSAAPDTLRPPQTTHVSGNLPGTQKRNRFRGIHHYVKVRKRDRKGRAGQRLRNTEIKALKNKLGSKHCTLS